MRITGIWIALVVALAGAAAAQTETPTAPEGEAEAAAPAPTPGAKFIRSGEKSAGFTKRARQNPCNALAAGDLIFCHEGTEWTQQGKESLNRPALYRLDDTRKAAITVLSMGQGRSTRLPPSVTNDLIDKYVFRTAPRGVRTLIDVVESTTDDNRQTTALLATAQTAEGGTELVQVTLFRLDRSFSFVETSTAFTGPDLPPNLSKDHAAVHQSFLDALRVNGEASVIRP